MADATIKNLLKDIDPSTLNKTVSNTFGDAEKELLEQLQAMLKKLLDNIADV